MIEMQIFGDDMEQMLHKALDEVARYDPDTYARMQASDWWITADPNAKTSPASDQWVMDEMDDDANAITISPWKALQFRGKVINRSYSLFNMPNTWTDAMEMRLPLEKFLAGIVVHEFQHTQKTHNDEPGAFDAGDAFFRKLPAGIGARLVQANMVTRQVELAG